jgi:uncharacterized protein YndB with AHSA1/START domain
MAVGETKHAGWEIGVSRTVPHPIGTVWRFLTSRDGVAVWLGDGVEFPLEVGNRYETRSGIVGEIRSFRPPDRIRLTWRPPDWDRDSTVQVAVRGDDSKTLIRFHQERLDGPAVRTAQKTHWEAIMARVVDTLEAADPPSERSLRDGLP